MKLFYFSYLIRKTDTQQKLLHNISEFMGAYHKSKNAALKGSFKRGDEKVYLTKIDGYLTTYYFLRTSDHDLLKHINVQNFSVNDIKDKLATDERMAFTAHMHLSSDKPIIAIASGIGSPRIDMFADYINELFKKVGLSGYEIEFTALSSNPTKQDLLQMEVINSIYVDIDADEGIGKSILKEIAGNSTKGIGSFRITIESSEGNMKSAFKGILNKIQGKNSGVIRVGAKAKHSELKGQLMDYWLENENVLSDIINPKAKRTSVPDQIGEKFDTNPLVNTLYLKFIQNQPNVISDADTTLLAYNDSAPFDAINVNSTNDQDSDSKA